MILTRNYSLINTDQISFVKILSGGGVFVSFNSGEDTRFECGSHAEAEQLVMQIYNAWHESKKPQA